ncbi:MAG: hypothetical protein RL139_397 [Gemmatimonadota bacterium]|jgi:molybdopterin converting factor small subunit
MALSVLCFASWGDVFGPRVEVDLPAGATVGDLLTHLSSRPEARRLPTPVVAVNRRYAAADVSLSAGDEIAIIPPVAGG